MCCEVPRSPDVEMPVCWTESRGGRIHLVQCGASIWETASFHGYIILNPEEIAVCAYLIWEKEGRLSGLLRKHWLRAGIQLLACRAHDRWPGGMESVAAHNALN
jgi:hypothetical protein